MTDIKETIQGLYSLKTYLASKAIEEQDPARESLIGMQKVVDSAVNLLKEQEPKTVQSIRTVAQRSYGYCPVCGRVITTMDSLPEHCYECPCHDGKSGYCQADEERRYSDYRPYWCPLKEIRDDQDRM